MQAKSDSIPAPLLTLVRSEKKDSPPEKVFPPIMDVNLKIFTSKSGKKYAAEITRRDAHTVSLMWIPLPRVSKSEEDFMSVYTDLNLLFQVMEDEDLELPQQEVAEFKNKVRGYLLSKKCFMTGLNQT
jgi:hypothetical protein